MEAIERVVLSETDRRAIEETLFRYSTAIDTGDFGLLEQVFTADARIDYTKAGGERLSGREAPEWLRSNLAHFKLLQHFVSNIRLSQEEDGVGSKAYVLAVHGYRSTEGKMLFFELGGQYEDQLVRTADGFRIAERVLQVRWLKGDIPTRG